MAHGRTASQQKTSGTPKHRDRRRIRFEAHNGSGRFEHTFTRPEHVVDLVRGWLESPDRPYSITISESEQTEERSRSS